MTWRPLLLACGLLSAGGGAVAFLRLGFGLTWSDISAIAQIVAAGGALVLVYATWKLVTATSDAAKGAKDAALATVRTQQQTVFAALLREYAEQEMYEALRLLSRRRRGQANRPAREVAAEIAGQDRHEYAAARRLLHHFVKKAWHLREDGAITDNQLTWAVVQTNGFELWANFALPLSVEVDREDQDRADGFAWADRFLAFAGYPARDGMVR